MAPFSESPVDRMAVSALGAGVEFPSSVRGYADDVVTGPSLMSVTEQGQEHGGPDEGAASLSPPVRDSLAVVIPVTVIYITIFITGLTGNVVTCLVIRQNRSMHTATNFYLFSLSISDLLLLVTGLPQDMYYIWSRNRYIFGEAFCIIRGLAAETSGNATVLTITAFTVERYMAICHPFYSHTLSKLSRATRLIILIWVVALAFAIPTAAQVGILVKKPDYSTCAIKHYTYAHYFCLLSVIFFLIPMCVIVVLYALIGLRLRNSNRAELMADLSEPVVATPAGNHRRRRGGRTHNHRSIRRVVKMLVAVVIAFFLCWAPFHAQRLVAIYGSNSDNSPKYSHMLKLYEIITYTSGILYYLSTAINPMLYNIMSHRFREAFKETVWVCCGKCRKENRRPYNNLPLRIQKPEKVGETDFASRSPRGRTDSKSGSPTQRTDSRSVVRIVGATEPIGYSNEGPAPDSPQRKAQGTPGAVASPGAAPSDVERQLTAHQAPTEAGTAMPKADEGSADVAMMSSVTAVVVPADRSPGEADEDADHSGQLAPFDSGEAEAKIPG